MSVKRPPRPVPINRRAITPIESWYATNLATWIAHYKRLPKITEFAAYCDRSIAPVWQALRNLERKGHVERVEVDDPDVGARKRFRPIGCEVSA